MPLILHDHFICDDSHG